MDDKKESKNCMKITLCLFKGLGYLQIIGHMSWVGGRLLDPGSHSMEGRTGVRNTWLSPSQTPLKAPHPIKDKAVQGGGE